MRWGICCGPGSFAVEVKNQPLSEVAGLIEIVADAGADYVEFPVGAVTPDKPEAEFDKFRAIMERQRLKAEAFNSFIPKTIPLVGPDATLSRTLEFCRIALHRCHALGGDVVVLGSAGARRIPEGFDPKRAEAQFLEFCREVGPIAESAKMDIALEPLNGKEDNFCISVEHGARLVRAANHPRITLLADLFHIAVEKEPFENTVNAGPVLTHTHVADIGRVAPGFAPEGEEDFVGFFRALRKAGYDRRCSFEGRFESIENQTKPLLELLKKRWAESA